MLGNTDRINSLRHRWGDLIADFEKCSRRKPRKQLQIDHYLKRVTTSLPDPFSDEEFCEVFHKFCSRLSPYNYQQVFDKLYPEIYGLWFLDFDYFKNGFNHKSKLWFEVLVYRLRRDPKYLNPKYHAHCDAYSIRYQSR